MVSRVSRIKIVPPKQRRTVIKRPGLLSEIESVVDYRLLLVVAPPGSGKTTLLSDFAASTKLKICWYSLEESDRDIVQFCTYLLNSVRLHYPDFGREFEEQLQNFLEGHTIEKDNNLSLLGQIFAENLYILADDFERANPGELFPDTIIILDDYHLAENQLIRKFVRSLLENMDQPFHLIIASRSTPGELPTTVLLSQNALRGIGAEAISFKKDEIARLLKEIYQVEDEERVDKLYNYSEGWITAVIMALANESTVLRKSSSPFSRGTFDSGPMFEYLGEKMFASLSEEMENFLLRTSALHLLTPHFCAEITGEDDVDYLLSQIANDNLITEYQPEGGSSANESYYKYHSLYQQYFQSRLKEKPDLWRECYRTAARLALESGNYQVAVSDYLEINEIDQAAEVLAQVCEEMYEAGRHLTQEDLLSPLPQKVIENNAELSYYQGLIHSDRGNFDYADKLLSFAEKQFIAQGKLINASKTLAARGMSLARYGQLNEAQPICERAMALVEGAGLPSADRKILRAKAMTKTVMGVVATETGRKDQAEQLFRDVNAIYKELGIRHYIAVSDMNLATLYASQGRLVRSNIYFERSLNFFTSVGNQASELYCRLGLSQNLLYRGSYTEAQRELNTTLQLADTLNNRYVKTAVYFHLGNLHSDTGRFNKAIEYYKNGLELSRGNRRQMELDVIAQMALAYLLNNDREEAHELLLQGHELNQEYQLEINGAYLDLVSAILEVDTRSFKKARELLNRIVAVFDKHQSLIFLSRSYLLLAFVELSLGDFKKALALLEDSIGLVEKIGYEPYTPNDIKRVEKLLEFAKNKKVSEALQNFLTKRGYPILPVAEETSGTERAETTNIDPHVTISIPERFKNETAAGGPRLSVIRANPIIDEKREGLLAASGNYVLEVRSLAGGRVWNAEREVEHWRMMKARELFFYLLEHGKCSRDEIIEALWPDADFASTPNLFHFTMNSLRKTIKPVEVKLSAQQYFLVGDIWHDVEELKRQVKLASVSPLINISELSAALELYQRDYLEPIYSDWASPRRAEILQTYLDGMALLAKAYESQNQIGQAIILWKRYLLKDPYNEDVYRALILCHLSMGNKKEARSEYKECLKMLEEMESIPTLQTQALSQKLA